MRAWLTLALFASGCVGGPEPPPPSCEGAPPLRVGRCIDETTGRECTGEPTELPRFESVGEGGSLTVVTGPQGSSMFVIAIETDGIDPGNPDRPVGIDNPLVDITVTDEGGATIGMVRRYAAFAADPELPGTFFNGGFFVVIDEACREGSRLYSVARLEDADGNRRCGELDFVVACGS